MLMTAVEFVSIKHPKSGSNIRIKDKNPNAKITQPSVPTFPLTNIPRYRIIKKLASHGMNAIVFEKSPNLS